MLVYAGVPVQAADNDRPAGDTLLAGGKHDPRRLRRGQATARTGTQHRRRSARIFPL